MPTFQGVIDREVSIPGPQLQGTGDNLIFINKVALDIGPPAVLLRYRRPAGMRRRDANLKRCRARRDNCRALAAASARIETA
jgi:hypothetical protein